MKKNDIEDLFKKSLENYEADVSPSVWKNIRIGLKWGSLALFFNMLLNKIGTNVIIALLSSAAVVISTVAIINKSDNASDKTSSGTNITTKTPTTIVEKTGPVLASDSKNQLNNIEQKAQDKNTLLDDKAKTTNSDQKTGLVSAKINAESTKKDNNNSESVTTTLSNELIASISANPIVGTAPLIVELTNNGKGKTNKWNYSDGKKGNSASNPVHVFETPGVYSVILTSINGNGKSAIDSIKVEVTGNASSLVPKKISPNGDGVNDVLSFNLTNIAKLSSKIFDNNGTIVFKSESTNAKWDGKDLQGKDAEVGLYYYVIVAEGVTGEKHESKGAIKLTR